MRIFILLCLISIKSTLLAQDVSLDQIRLNYTKAVSDKGVCQSMITTLKGMDKSPINLAYLGGFEAIWANYVFSPFSKLSTFNTGKHNIESAVKMAPENPEIRYIRLSIQKNIPAILGYSKNIQEDTAFLEKHKSEIKSEVVLKNLQALLNK